jgi:hypothetical protein
MIRPNTEWKLYNGEFCNPAAGGLASVDGFKHIIFVDDKSLMLKGESEGTYKMDFILMGNVIVPTAIDNSPVDSFVGETRLKLRIEAMTEHELILVLLDTSTEPSKDFLRLFYRPPVS